MKHLFARFLRHQQGVALIEFAIVFPFMFLLLFGGIEVTRYILILQKIEKAAYVLTNIVGQYNPATPAAAQGEISLNALNTEVIPQLHRMMGVYGYEPYEGIILSSVVKRGSGVKLAWRRSYVGQEIPGAQSVTGTGLSDTYGSAPAPYGTGLGTTCPSTNFPAEVASELVTMLDGENMIIGEIFFRYKPIVGDLYGVTVAAGGEEMGFSMAEQTIVRRVYLSPRKGKLLSLPPNHPAYPETPIMQYCI